MPALPQLTERQQKWFASVRAGLEQQTGKSLEQWATLAKACPETTHRKRLEWMKGQHGLGQNHASLVLNAAFPPEASWSTPDALATALWCAPVQKAIFEQIRASVANLPDVIVGQRRGFTAFSRKVQFAAARPARSDDVLLGLAVETKLSSRLTPSRKDSWSERLTSTCLVTSPALVDLELQELLRAAWERS